MLAGMPVGMLARKTKKDKGETMPKTVLTAKERIVLQKERRVNEALRELAEAKTDLQNWKEIQKTLRGTK